MQELSENWEGNETTLARLPPEILSALPWFGFRVRPGDTLCLPSGHQKPMLREPAISILGIIAVGAIFRDPTQPAMESYRDSAPTRSDRTLALLPAAPAARFEADGVFGRHNGEHLPGNWRATAWEAHPITSIEVVPAP